MTKRKPPVPVKWSAILPHVGAGRDYRAMGRPFPVYGGALFVVGFKTQKGQALFAVMRYLTKEDKVEGVTTDAAQTIPAFFGTSTMARQWAATHSAEEVRDYGKKATVK